MDEIEKQFAITQIHNLAHEKPWCTNEIGTPTSARKNCKTVGYIEGLKMQPCVSILAVYKWLENNFHQLKIQKNAVA